MNEKMNIEKMMRLVGMKMVRLLTMKMVRLMEMKMMRLVVAMIIPSPPFHR